MSTFRLPTHNQLSKAFQAFHALKTSDDLEKEPAEKIISRYQNLLDACEKFNPKIFGPLLCQELEKEYIYITDPALHLDEKLKTPIEKLKSLFASIKSVPKSASDAATQTPPAVVKVLSKQEELAKHHYEETRCMTSDILDKSKVFTGIHNEVGTDCFLISCIQFLKLPYLKKHIIDKLPTLLYNLLTCSSPSSSKIRSYLLTHPGFKNKCKEHGVDLRSGQLDAHETFTSLLEISEYQEDPQAIVPYEDKKAPTSGKDTKSNFFILNYLYDKWNTSSIGIKKLLVGVLLVPVIVYTKLYEKITSSINFLLKEDEDICMQEGADTEENSKPVEPKPAQNPLEKSALLFELVYERTWDTSAVAEEFRSDDNFGGISNTSIKREPAEFLLLPLSTDKSISVQQSLDSFFSAETNADPSKITVLDEGEEKTYEAPCRVKAHLNKAPEALCLSFKRTLFDPIRKNLHPIENIETFTLDESCFSDQKESAQYDLKSFIVQKGTSPRFGHYICCRKEGNDWFYFDDSRAYKITEAAAFRIGKHASMTFYEKRS